MQEHQPDLVILDIRMNGEERVWTILSLLTLDPETPFDLDMLLEMVDRVLAQDQPGPAEDKRV